MTHVLCALLLSLAQGSAALPARPELEARPAPSGGAALRIDGVEIGLDAYARWLMLNFGEMQAQVYAREYVVVEREAQRLGVDVGDEECARRVDAAIQERIAKAFFGRKSEWLAELDRTRRTEAGVRLQRETEMRAYALAERMAAIDRVVPDHKIERDWQHQYGRNGRRYDLHMTKTLVVVPSKERQSREEWQAERQRVMDEGEERARAVRARILAGEDFGKVARETSDDPETRDGRGVPRTRFSHYQWPRRFLDELEKLAPGEVSEPLFARGGWWIVRVDDVQVTPLADVREALRARLEAKGPEDDEVAGVLEGLREATTFKILPALFADGPDPELHGANEPVLEVNGQPVARGAYARWLIAIQGEPSLQRFLEDWAITRRARELGVSVTEEEVAARVTEVLKFRVRERGSREAWTTFLRLNGRTEDSYMRSLHERTRTDLLAEKMLVLQREITPEQVRQRFRSEFGPDGERIEARWMVFLNALEDVEPEWTREQLTEAMEQASERSRARAAEVVRRVRAGEDFAALAREHSDDLETRADGGRIPGRFRADVYPDAFGAAVAGLRPGATTEPLDYGNAWVVFQVVARRKVTFDEVEAELRAEMLAERPNGLHVNAHRNELTQKLEVEILPGMAAR